MLEQWLQIRQRIRDLRPVSSNDQENALSAYSRISKKANPKPTTVFGVNMNPRIKVVLHVRRCDQTLGMCPPFCRTVLGTLSPFQKPVYVLCL